MKHFSLVLIINLILLLECHAQEVKRPQIWGVAGLTFLVNDFNIVREYYADLLGFEESFSYSNTLGKIISFKINDRQFLEFIENKTSEDKYKLINVMFDCDSPAKMEIYLRSKNIPIIQKTEIDAAGNEVMTIKSSEFYSIKFIRYLPGGLHKKSNGKFLGENRIAQRLHHVGLYISDIESKSSV